MAQHSRRKIGLPAVRIDQRPVLAPRHRVDREVAPLQILLERHIGRREELEPAVSVAMLALGSRQRVFVLRFRMQEDGKVAADRTKARREHDLRGGADHGEIAVGVLATQQFVAHGAADAIDAHGLRQRAPAHREPGHGSTCGRSRMSRRLGMRGVSGRRRRGIRRTHYAGRPARDRTALRPRAAPARCRRGLETGHRKRLACASTTGCRAS